MTAHVPDSIWIHTQSLQCHDRQASDTGVSNGRVTAGAAMINLNIK